MILLIKDKRFHSTSIADRQLPFLDSRSAGWVAVALRRCNLSVKKNPGVIEGDMFKRIIKFM